MPFLPPRRRTEESLDVSAAREQEPRANDDDGEIEQNVGP
jgi:hypothetical protein